MYILFHEKFTRERGVRWAEVRTEGKLLVSMLKGLVLLLSHEN